jgi:2-C-methyl-D-erythritol 2,4-cyclodiphosphate synthase
VSEARDVRIGVGVDAHPFEVGRPLILGGVQIDHPSGLAGHSDGDALSHAVVDAVLGAAGLGDIGTLFPSTDERWQGASSLGFIVHAAVLLRSAGLGVANIDATVICESPRIAPHRQTIAVHLAESLGISTAQVSVKGTTTDGMGFTGRGEGIAAIVVALVEPV